MPNSFKLNYYALLLVIINDKITPQQAVQALTKVDNKPGYGFMRGKLIEHGRRKQRQGGNWYET